MFVVVALLIGTVSVDAPPGVSVVVTPERADGCVRSVHVSVASDHELAVDWRAARVEIDVVDTLSGTGRILVPSTAVAPESNVAGPSHDVNAVLVAADDPRGCLLPSIALHNDAWTSLAITLPVASSDGHGALVWRQHRNSNARPTDVDAVLAQDDPAPPPATAPPAAAEASVATSRWLPAVAIAAVATALVVGMVTGAFVAWAAAPAARLEPRPVAVAGPTT